MESGVEEVCLGCRGDLSLDIRTLTQYSGQGKCGKVLCNNETAEKYWDELRSWVMRINWKVYLVLSNNFVLISRF